MVTKFMDTMISGLLGLLPSIAMTLATAVVMYLSYWWALYYSLISFNENGMLTLKPKKLPPGSMGLPPFGQTLVWRKNPGQFYDSQWRRHGEIYKTHLFGFPTVVVTTQGAAKNLLISNGESLKGNAPGTVQQLLGARFLLYKEGDLHTLLRKRLMKYLKPEALKRLVPAMEELAMKHLSDWSNESNIIFLDEVERYTLGVGMLALFGPLPPLSAAKLNQHFEELQKGFNCMPINKPGFQFYKSMQARNSLLKEVQNIIKARKMDHNSNRAKDILDSLLDEADPLTQDVIDDNVVAFLFGADRTSAGVLSITVKYLHDHPDVLQAVKHEQQKIWSRKAYGDPLSWEDLKQMVYTFQVIQESARIGNVASFQYRLVQKEIEYKGYIIPKNWRLISLQRQWHLDPQVFPDPYKFDPSRFQTPQQAFTPFGMGTHFCAGYELVRLELLIFLHHFTTKFRWEVTEDGPNDPDEIIFSSRHARLPLKLTHL